MNMLFFATDDVYKQQMNLAQEMAQQVSHKLSEITQGNANPLKEESVLFFYPRLPIEEQSSVVLDSFLESVRDYMFSDGLPVEEKVSLLRYHFNAVMGEETQATLRKMLDDTVMSNGKDLKTNKKDYIAHGLPALSKIGDPILTLRDKQRTNESELVRRRSELRIAQHIRVTTNGNQSSIQKVEGKISTMLKNNEQIQKQLNDLDTQYRNLHQQHFSPLLELSYDANNLARHIKHFWGLIVERCVKSEQSAVPPLLQRTMFDKGQALQDNKEDNVVIVSTNHQGYAP